MSSTLFFDFDGTLIDSAPGILKSFELVLQEKGVEPKVALGTHLIGPPLPQTMALISGETDPARLKELIEAFKVAYDTEGYKATVPYGALHETVQQLFDAGHRLILLTNKRRYPTERILEWFALDKLFSGIFTPDTWTPALTSKVDTMRRALDELALDPEHCVMIGDSADDVHAAAENGMPFIAAAFGYGDAATQNRFPVHGTILTLDELPAIIERSPWLLTE